MQFKDLINAEAYICRSRLFMQQAVTAAFLLAWVGGSPFADVSITQLANEGVMITDGKTRILIDAMVVEPYSIYGGLPDEVLPLFEQLSGPFSGIDLMLVSHRHHDHNQPRFACQFMQDSLATELVSSSQVLGLMREKCRQFLTTSPRVREIDPQYGEPHVIEQENARITIFPLSHGTGKYARLENYGHLLEIGDMKVLHVGDAAMDPADYIKAGLDNIDIDVALIPFWYFQPGPGNQLVNRFLAAPHKIAVHIPPGEMDEVKAYMGESFPLVTILENTLDQASFTATLQPLR
jgi:L-ascorbate metabolism protein UlaG (beta-lactamase superfamily)